MAETAYQEDTITNPEKRRPSRKIGIVTHHILSLLKYAASGKRMAKRKLLKNASAPQISSAIMNNLGAL
jgi:hypothetical protein